MDREELLKKVDLFSGLKKKDLKSLAESCVERFFKKGETLVKQGEHGVGLFMIVSGKVKVVKETAFGPITPLTSFFHHFRKSDTIETRNQGSVSR